MRFGRESGLGGRGGDQEFGFGHVMLVTPTRHTWEMQIFKAEVQGDLQGNKGR